jgi:hypothetical protein
MSHWNLKRAARLGYLAGRGLSVESINGRPCNCRSKRARRTALGIGSPFTILLSLEDRLALECVAVWTGGHGTVP